MNEICKKRFLSENSVIGSTTLLTKFFLSFYISSGRRTDLVESGTVGSEGFPSDVPPSETLNKVYSLNSTWTLTVSKEERDKRSFITFPSNFLYMTSGSIYSSHYFTCFHSTCVFV